MPDSNGHVLSMLFDTTRFLADDNHSRHHVHVSIEATSTPLSLSDALVPAAAESGSHGGSHEAEDGASHGHDHADHAQEGGGEGHPTTTLDIDFMHDEDLHVHGDRLKHDHSEQARFGAAFDIDLLDETWHMHIATADGFIEIPTSGEIVVWVVGAITFAVGLFALVRGLGRSRDRARRESATTAERFAVGFGQSPIGVVELDRELRLVAVNEAAAELAG